MLITVFSLVDIRLFQNNNVFRIDLRGIKSEQNINIVSNNQDVKFEQPNWCKDCIVINSNFDKEDKKNLRIKFKTLKENDLVFIRLMGPDVRIDNKRIPVIVNYENFVVNGQNVFSKKQGFWHDSSYDYSVQIEAGKTVEFEVTVSKPYGQRFLRPFQILSGYIFIIVLLFWWFVLYTIVNYVNKHKDSKPDALFIAVFILMLFLPMLNISGAKISIQENRVLATKPSLFINNDINEQFGTQFNNWFNDRFFGRNTFIKIFDAISYSLKRVYQNDKALFIKQNGWMFEKQDFPVPKNTKIIVDNLKSFDDFCKSYNMKLYVLVVPEKEQIYQDILTKFWFFDKKQESLFNDYMKNMINVLPDDRIIYPYQELLSAKDNDYVFFKQSHHWTDFGAYTGYKLLGERIKNDFSEFNIVSLFDYNKVVSKNIRDDWGRAYLMSGYTVGLLNLNSKSNVIFDTKYNYYNNRSEYTVTENRQKYTKIFNNKDQKAKYKLFLTGNSQNENLLQFLPYSVKQLKYLRLNWFQQNEENQWKFMKFYKQELLDFNPDIVVIVITADVFSQLMTDFYKD